MSEFHGKANHILKDPYENETVNEESFALFAKPMIMARGHDFMFVLFDNFTG